jgi:hypothetical protein
MDELGTGTRLRPAEVRRALTLTFGFWLIYVASLAPGIYSIDGNSMLAVAESIVTHHSFVVSGGLGIPGVGGRIYSWWYPLLSIITVPLAYLASLVSRGTHLPFHYVAAILALLWPAALTAATAGVVALLTLRLGGTWLGSWLGALSFGFGTVALAYARTFYAEPLLSFLIVSALFFAFGCTLSEILLASFFAALAVLAKPTGVMIGPILTGYLVAKRVPLRRSILPLIGTSLGFVVYAGYNVLRFGNPLNFGPAWSFGFVSFLPGVVGLLASPWYGIIWYCPPVLLAILGFRKAAQTRPLEVLTIFALLAGFLFLHSLLPYWNGGWSWGPRYLVPAIPGLCALAGLLEGNSRRALAVLTLLGFLINAPTTFSFFERYYAELTEQGVLTAETSAWSFRHAPFVNGWPAAVHQTKDAMGVDVKDIFAQRGNPSTKIESSRALRVVAVWWWVLPVAHVPRWVGFLVALLMTALGCLLVFWARGEIPLFLTRTGLN